MKRIECSAIVVLAALSLAAAACGQPLTTAEETQTPNRSLIKLHPRDVRGMPILWLGESYDSDGDGAGDMPLTAARLNTTRPLNDPRTGREISPSSTSFQMIYGTCTPPTPKPGDDRADCAVPLDIHFFGVCNARTIYGLERMPIVSARGVDARERSPGELWVETADFTVLVMAWGHTPDELRANARRVVEDLVGANGDAAAFGRATAFRARTSASPCNGPTAPDE